MSLLDGTILPASPYRRLRYHARGKNRKNVRSSAETDIWSEETISQSFQRISYHHFAQADQE